MRLGVRGTIPGASLREKAEALQRTGFDGIELGTEYLNQPAEEILRQLSGTGIAVTAIVGSIKLLHPDSKERQTAIPLDRERFAMAKALGASAVIEVPVFGEPRFNDLPTGTSPRDYAKQFRRREYAIVVRFRAGDHGGSAIECGDDLGLAEQRYFLSRIRDVETGSAEQLDVAAV